MIVIHDYSFSKYAGVDPLLFQDAPEVFGQATEDVVVGKPAIAVLSPGSAPGVADEEGALCFLLAEFIGNFQFVVIKERIGFLINKPACNFALSLSPKTQQIP